VIIQLRGTSGSGKSTAMRRVMDSLGDWNAVYAPGRKKPQLYYTAAGSEWGRVAVLGQ
jgi:ABC-type dipeptide/oligopeptide/nickel transport system ATPase component